MFGSRVSAEIESAVAGAKNDTQATQRRNRVLNKWLGTEQKFRDPVATAPGAVSSKQSGPVQL